MHKGLSFDYIHADVCRTSLSSYLSAVVWPRILEFRAVVLLPRDREDQEVSTRHPAQSAAPSRRGRVDISLEKRSIPRGTMRSIGSHRFDALSLFENEWSRTNGAYEVGVDA